MSELVAFSRNPAWIVESARWQGSHSWHGFQGEAEIAPAPTAELDVEPAPGFIGDMPVSDDGITQNFDLGLVEDRLHAERRTGSTLAPQAVAHRHPLRFSSHLEPNSAAHTSARVFRLAAHVHLPPDSPVCALRSSLVRSATSPGIITVAGSSRMRRPSAMSSVGDTLQQCR